jgi:S-formylglutathione hydrolase
MSMEQVSANLAFGGVQGVYEHASSATGTDMTFSVYVPPHEEGAKLPVVWYLSGLTCTHANVTEKGEFRSVWFSPSWLIICAGTRSDCEIERSEWCRSS